MKWIDSYSVVAVVEVGAHSLDQLVQGTLILPIIRTLL